MLETTRLDYPISLLPQHHFRSKLVACVHSQTIGNMQERLVD
jgi:hypothetical protein